ncbi:MAG: hypothetical protein K5924_03105 [Chloroflexi bacterium]|nr:hypothetical protein [Chloroflexota bacterium]
MNLADGWLPFLVLALAIMGWRRIRRGRGRPRGVAGPLPDVADAPADAQPMLTPRLDDNGLATFTMVVPRRRR